MLRATLLPMFSRNSWRRGIAFEGTGIPHSVAITFAPLTMHFLPISLSTVRSGKVAGMRAAYAKYGDRVDIVVADDLVDGDFTEIMKGVHAVIFVASVFPGRESIDTTIHVSICFPSHLFLSNHLGRSVIPHVP